LTTVSSRSRWLTRTGSLRIRPHRDWDAIAERFFLPSEAAAFLASPDADRDSEFFRRWTRLEAMWKAAA